MASPLAHDGGFPAHYRLDEMKAAERREEQLACDHEFATHPQEQQLIQKNGKRMMLSLLLYDHVDMTVPQSR